MSLSAPLVRRAVLAAAVATLTVPSIAAAGVDVRTTTTADGTEVLVTGSDGANDSIGLSANGSDVIVTDNSGTTPGDGCFAQAGSMFDARCNGTFARLVFDGRGGSDSVRPLTDFTLAVRAEGGAQDDSLTGGAGGDTLSGGSGADQLDGGDGADLLSGGPGTDGLVGGPGADDLDGGADQDIVSYRDAPGPVTVRIDDLANDGGEQDGFADRIRNVESVYGSSFGDTLVSSPTERVFLLGEDGNDTLIGSTGGEQLYGGAGDDVLESPTDQAFDTFDCGPGYDRATGDQGDNFSSDCEEVTRRQPPTQQPPPSSGGPGTPGPISYVPPTFVPAKQYARVEPIGDPVLEGNDIVVRIAAGVGDRITATLKTGTRQIGSGQGVVEVVAGESTATRPGQPPAGETVIRVPMTPADRSTLASMAALRFIVVLDAIQGDYTYTTEYATAVAKPRSRAFGKGGRTRDGGFGADTVTGTARGDTLLGGSGDDRLVGRAGLDKLLGGTGNDTLEGGPGADLLDGFDGDDRSFGGDGDDDIIESRFGDDILDGGIGNDYIDGARGVDLIRGGAGDDVIRGGSGPDTVDCGPGDDVVFVNLKSERRTVRNCELVLSEGTVVSRPCTAGGTEQGETLLGTDGPDVCRGGLGNDDLEGAGGDDQLFGEGGDDRMFGRFGVDLMEGGPGDDELEGGRGKDVLRGGPGNDQLNGGLEADVVDGGAGDDRIVARGGGRDTVTCGPGRDTVVADRSDRLRGCETVRLPR